MACARKGVFYSMCQEFATGQRHWESKFVQGCTTNQVEIIQKMISLPFHDNYIKISKTKENLEETERACLI
jgi:hypothetical protein